MINYEPLLAFAEGLALIASPCILPVLPLVLSSSIDGGKARPFGIITGFVTAFSLFVLLSRHIVEAFHIDTDIIRNISLVLLFALGLILLSEKLSGWFSRVTQGAADLGSKFGAGGQGGFISGIGIGALIGLVWTPCAGPILAAVLVQVIRQQTDLQSILVTVGFAVGAGIPMLIIALVGRKVMGRIGFLTTHSEQVRKGFGVLILLAVAYMAFGDKIASALTEEKPALVQTVASPVADHLENPLDQPYPAPELVGIQAWLNSNPLTMAQLRGKVVLIDFWTYSCINCVRTLPYVTQWDRQYRDKGLVIIGVHAPEFEFEKNVDNVRAALAQRGITYPVAIDNNLATWVNYKNRFWPAHYLINKDGQVVYTHFGEGDYDVTENNIRYLLGLTGKVAPPAMLQKVEDQTQETYLGYARAERNSNEDAAKHDAAWRYTLPETLPAHHWALGGKWKVEGQKITALSKDAALRLKFNARKVFLVLGTSDGKPHDIMLKLNGQATGTPVTVNSHTLYQLIEKNDGTSAVLEITAQPGVEAYAFTFGG